MNVSTCQGCGAPIVWVVTEAGRNMPCDLELLELAPGPGGDVLVTDDGRVVSGRVGQVALLGDLVEGRVPHWATCPEGERFR